jgi:hypothetical protein
LWLCLDPCWSCWGHWLKLHHWSVDGGSAGLLEKVEGFLRLLQVGEGDVNQLPIKKLLFHLHFQARGGLHASTGSAVESGETSPKVKENPAQRDITWGETLNGLGFIFNSVGLHFYPRRKTILI